MTNRWYRLNLEDKTEYLDMGASMERRPAGYLLAAYLETDWTVLYAQCEQLHTEICRRPWDGLRDGAQLVALYRSLQAQLGQEPHPLLQIFADSQLAGVLFAAAMDETLTQDPAPYFACLRGEGAVAACEPWFLGKRTQKIVRESLKQMLALLHHHAIFYEKLHDMVLHTMEPNGPHGNLPVRQRYGLYRGKDVNYAALAERHYPLLYREQVVYCNNHLLMDGQHKHAGGLDEIEIGAYQATDDLCALVLLEYDYMIAHDLCVRRCGNCQRYFVPYSVAACYCRRPLADRPGKTCQDIAPAARHLERVSQNEAKLLYRKVNNRFQMAARRHEKSSLHAKTDYQTWHTYAIGLMEQYQAGEIAFWELEQKMQIKPADLVQMAQKNP